MSKDPTITTEDFPLARSLSLMNLAAEVEVVVGLPPSPTGGSGYRDAPGRMGSRSASR